MKHHTPKFARRNTRAFTASLLAYLLLVGQLTPLAFGSNRPATPAAPPRAGEIARESKGEAQALKVTSQPSSLASAAFVSNITATKTDSYPSSPNPAQPGETITYTVTITNNGPDDATNVTLNDTVDSNTTLIGGSATSTPIAFNDTASAFGNVRISTANGAPNLLANDIDPDSGTNTGLTASGPTTGPTNGQATVSSNGEFTYNPNPGFTGSDSFTYTITDPQSKTATGTVNITVGPTLIWFINNQAGAGGDGRITSPFNSIAAFNAGAADDPGDIIFIYTGTGTYTGGITLLNTQKLIGQGFALQTETGAPPAGSDPLPTAGAAPTIDNPGSNIITLGQNNTLRGFNTGNSGAAGTDISGTSFGTLTVSALSINGDGRALNLTTGTLAATVANISASNTGSNAGLVLNAVGGALTVSGSTSITNPGGTGIDVTNAPAGHNFNFGGTTVNKNSTAGIGVNLSTNAGTTTFTSLTVTTGASFALQTNNAGTVNVTTGSLTQSGAGGGAASLTNTVLGMTFTSVSSNGGANGIIISGGSGSFTSGTTNLQNNAGIGLLMSSSAVVAGFGNTTVNSSAGDAVDLASNTGNITFADLDMTPDAGLRGLDATGNTGTITVTSGDITTSGGATASAVFIDGPAGRTPINITFTTATTSGVGNTSNIGSITLIDVSGTKFQMTGTTQINTRAGMGVFVDNSTATNIQFATVNVPNPSAAGGHGFHVEDSSSTVTVTTATISDANQTSQQTDGGSDGIPDSDGDGDAIFLRGNSGSFTLSGGTLSNCGNDCVDARNSVNVALSGLTITNPGIDTTGATGAGQGGHGIAFINLTGTNTVTGTTISGFNVANRDGLYLINNTGTTATTVHGSTFQNSTGNAGIVAIGQSTANITLTVGGPTNNVTTNCTFTNLSGSAIIANSGDTSTLNVTIQRSTFQTAPNDGKTNITGINTQTADVTWNILNNTFTNVMRTASTAEGVISIASLGTGNGNTFGATVTGNNISGVGFGTGTPCGGGVTFCAGSLSAMSIVVDGTTGVPNTIVVDSNSVTNAQQGGIKLDMVNSGTGSTAVNAKITNNIFGNTGAGTNIGRGGTSVTVLSGIIVERRRNNSPAGNVLISGNTIRNGNGTSGNTLNGVGMLVRTKANSNLSATVTGNNVDTNTSNAVAEMRFDTNANDVGDIVSPTMCIDVNSNTFPAGAAANIDFNEINGTLNVEQTSAANVQAVNGGSVSVTTSGGESFGVACATPPAAPSQEEEQPEPPPGPVDGGETTEAAAPAAPAATTSSMGGGVTSRPFISPMPDTRGAMDTPRNAPTTDTTTATSRGRDIAPVQEDEPPQPQPPVISGNNITWNIGTLPAGKSVTITFQVTINDPLPSGTTQVCNQGQVSGGGFSTLNTDDPGTGAPNDATCTPVQPPPDIFIRDASGPEPPSPDTNDMAFAVVLSNPSSGTVTVNFTTNNGGPNPATAGTCGSGGDYTPTNGQVSFAPGQTVQTISVPICSDAVSDDNETFLVDLSGATGGNISDGQAVGTITPNTPGALLISEMRTSGPGGTADDFVEIYNNSDTPHTVDAADNSGYGIFKMGATCADNPVLVGTIPEGQVIPARGHYLLVGSAYSLGSYPAGNGTTATGNATLTADIENDRNVGLFKTATLVNISSALRLDAVGFGTNVGLNCNLLREATPLNAASGSTSEYAFVRKMETGSPQDTNSNTADFTIVSTTPSTPVGNNATPVLGAPGPENLSSPIVRGHSPTGISSQLLDPAVCSSCMPNRERVTSPPVTNGALGTLTIRRSMTNNTGAPVTRLRFRIIQFTTFNSPNQFGGAGQADLRAINSVDATVTTSMGPVLVRGTTIETPPAQPNGGGLNSSYTLTTPGVITMGTPLMNGASVNVQFTLGVQTNGKFNFFIVIEALP